MRALKLVSPFLVVLSLSLALAPGVAGAQSAQERAMAQVLIQIEQKTGLKSVEIPEADGAWLGKTHRGYQVLYTAKAGNVWGRYAARLTMGEIGREVGGVLGWLTGQKRHLGGTVVGSPLDQLLAAQIGQPLSVTVVLRHGKPNAPRLDVLSGYAKVKPDVMLAERGKVGHNAGSIHADDAAFAAKVAANETLMKRMKNLRTQYIRVDGETVTFFFSGSETDYSGMIRDHGDYFKMLNDVMDNLADLADAIPAK
ncbi:MAG: hypothetical protein JNM76_18390 [Betaproteobacteria bacterium]|nr:hypothetical protein [Betaproteobacteria bacterium]